MSKNVIDKKKVTSLDKSTKGDNTAKPLHNRRTQDSTSSTRPAQRKNSDRRNPKNERRKNSNPNYRGPSRRYTIDRRISAKDRRVAI